MHQIPEPTGETRTETDTFGPIKVPVDCYYGAQTARSMYHFNIGLPTGKINFLSFLFFLMFSIRSNASSID